MSSAVDPTVLSGDWLRPDGAVATEVRHETVDGVVVFGVRGDVDIPDADALRPLLVSCIRPAGSTPPRAVVLDLGEVGFFGSAGLNLLVRARKEAAAGGVALHGVRRDGRSLARALQITGLDAIMPWHASTADALREAAVAA